MKSLSVPIEVLLTSLCCWTLAYHGALLVGLPAGWIAAPFVVLLLVIGRALGPGWVRVFRKSRWRSRWLVAATSLCVFTGTLTTVLSRPDNDDFSYFHRAVYQIAHLDLPVITNDTYHNVDGLPGISPLHVMTAYEPFVAIVSSAVGLDPVSAYQNLGGMIAAMLLPCVYILLYRRFGLSRLASVVATSVCIAFLLIDGNTHRSFGNMGFVRMWQGKAILWSVLLPLLLLYSRNFLASPSTRNFGLLVMASICGVGLSNAAVYLIPTFVFALALAYLLTCGLARRTIHRAFLLSLSTAYCVGIAAALVAGWLLRPVDTHAWFDAWPLDWVENIGLVVGDAPTLLRNAIILSLPLFTLRRPLGRFATLFSLALVLLCVNPVVAPLWIEAIYPASYWRFAYLFPLVWCAGLVGAALLQFALADRRSVMTWIGAVAAVAAIGATAAAFRQPVISNETRWKTPVEYKFRPAELAFARSVSEQLDDRNLLAPEDVLVVLALLNPTVELEAARASDQQTLHIFANAGKREEGVRRVLAQELVSLGQQSRWHLRSFRRSLRNGVDSIITRKHLAPEIGRLLDDEPTPWIESARDERYTLFLRQPGG